MQDPGRVPADPRCAFACSRTPGGGLAGAQNGAGAAVPAVTTVPERDEVEPGRRWDLSALFREPSAWESEAAHVGQLLERLAACSGTLGDGADALAAALELHAELGVAIDRVYVFACLKRDEDTRDTAAQALADRATQLAVRVEEAAAFLEPEILALPEETLRSFLAAPRLQIFGHYLRNLLRLKENTLSPREERILALAGEVTRVPRTAFGMLNDADLRFRSVRDEEGREIELTRGRLAVLLESSDRRVRADAWQALMEAYAAHRNTIAALLAGAVKRDLFFARVRSYPSCLAAALHPGNIPQEVFHTALRTASENRGLCHRCVRLRKRALKLPEVRVYDLHAPLGPTEPWRIRYDEACRLLREGLAPLGEEYGETLAAGLDGGWVDVVETRGKRSGAYSWGAYGSHPYVLLNYQGTLDDLFTLAHEMGHALHHHYATAKQPYVYAHAPTFLAEIASTTNEVLLVEHLLATVADPQKRLALLNQYVDQIQGTVITQLVFAEFEHAIHERAERGEPLTADALSDEYARIFTRMLGPDLAFDALAALGWAKIPHFHSAYYVYQYATGYAAAVALARRIRSEGALARADYLALLEAGDSDYPIDLLRQAGVDLATSAPLEDTFALFQSLLEKLEQLVTIDDQAAASGGEG
jgi:oligoendopeptidase F